VGAYFTLTLRSLCVALASVEKLRRTDPMVFHLTLRGFNTFQTNLLTIPSTVLFIIVSNAAEPIKTPHCSPPIERHRTTSRSLGPPKKSRRELSSPASHHGGNSSSSSSSSPSRTRPTNGPSSPSSRCCWLTLIATLS
jgi:hypothetical protein